MTKTERLGLLEQAIVEKEFLTIEEIRAMFHVHINTVRSDIRELINRGVAVKRYGGVGRAKEQVPSTFIERKHTNIDAKEFIGIKAARYLEEGDIIFVDAGTTVSQLFGANRALPMKLTVVTNNICAMNWVLTNTDYNVYMLPGRAERQLNSISSIETIDSLLHYNFRKAFIGCRKIAADGSLTSASLTDAKIKETAIGRSQRVFLMADALKLGTPELYNFGNISQVDCWICDEITSDVCSLAQLNGVKVE